MEEVGEGDRGNGKEERGGKREEGKGCAGGGGGRERERSNILAFEAHEIG
jgi:hypothetical protein